MSKQSSLSSQLSFCTREIILCADKFNACATALSGILAILKLKKDFWVHIAYLDKGFLGEIQYQNFRLQPKSTDNDHFVIRLDSNAGVKHFQSTDVPFLSSEQVQAKEILRIEKGNLHILVSINKELMAALEISGIFKSDIQGEKEEFIVSVSQFLGIALQNITNDFQLLLLKKQSENQRKQIQKNNDTIQRQNRIFRSLMEIMSKAHKTDLEGIFNHTLEQLCGLFPSHGFGLIVDGERDTIVQWAVFLGIEKKDQTVLIANCAKLLNENPSSLLHTKEDYSVLCMKGREKHIIGKLILKGAKLDPDSQEIIYLFLEQLSAYTENQLLIRELERVANTDGLTNTYNRLYFNREMDRTILNSRRFPGLYFTVFLMDLNGLKRVNDVYGHPQGDAMIIKAAEIVLVSARKSDIVCRLGGDEFVILCPSTNYEQAQQLLSRIREKETGACITCSDKEGNQETVFLHFSIGIASSSEGIAPAKVLDIADQRMYADKEEYYRTQKRYR